MAASTQVEWVDRKSTLIASLVFFTILSTTFVILRAVVAFAAKRRYLLSDYLIFLAAVSRLYEDISCNPCS